MTTLHLKPGLKPLPYQLKFMAWKPDSYTLQNGFSEEAILGGWGAAKSSALLLKAFVLACANSWHEGYDTLVPRIAICGPAERAVINNLMPKFLQICPKPLIKRRAGRPFPSLTLINGCRIEFTSFDSVIEGDDLAAVLIDEVHLINDTYKFQNLRNRVRDPHASYRAFCVAGLPQAGWVREQYDPASWKPEEHLRRQTMLVGTKDNPNLPKSHLDNILSSISKAYERSVMMGGWMPTFGALYSDFDRLRHVIPDSYVQNAPIAAVGIDLGISSAAAMVQKRDLPSVGSSALVIGDVVQVGGGTEELCLKLKAHPYGHLIVPGLTVFCIDPSAYGGGQDARAAIHKVFPGAYVHQQPRTSPYISTANGITLTQAALLNGKNETRLQFVESLTNTKHGVIDAMLNEKLSPITGKRMKVEAKQEHSADALRYAVQYILGSVSGFDPQSYTYR